VVFVQRQPQRLETIELMQGERPDLHRRRGRLLLWIGFWPNRSHGRMLGPAVEMHQRFSVR